MLPIPERNRQILEMRAKGISQIEFARQFGLSPSRIWLIERRDRTDRAMAERRVKLREEIRAADDLERMWPVEDLVDALDSILVTRIRLLQHFTKTEKAKISLRELMDMWLYAPVEGL
jgi:transcriptional regulator with XRE-family HTH domain